MFIKTMVLEGPQGDIEIARTDDGALVTIDRLVLGEAKRSDDREARYRVAVSAAIALYGARRGRPNATNSMVHEILDAIDRVAGC